MGYGTSLGTAHEDELSAVLEPWTTKELSDRKEIQANETSGDFQSRFGAIDIRPINQSTMPLEASRKLTDALKRTGGSKIPENEPETKLPDIEDVQPTFAEDVFGKGQNDIRPALTNLLQKTVDTLKGPGDALSGKLPMWATDPETGEVHTSTQAIEKATDLAGLASSRSCSSS